MRQPLTGNAALRAQAQATSKINTSPGGWLQVDRGEPTEGSPNYNPQVAAVQNAKIAGLIPKPQVSDPGTASLYAELAKGMPAQAGPLMPAPAAGGGPRSQALQQPGAFNAC